MLLNIPSVLPLVLPATATDTVTASDSHYHLSDKDAARYADGYTIYLPRTNFRGSLIEIIRRNMPAPDSMPHKSDGNILDVGCSDGLMTDRYLGIIKAIPKHKVGEVFLVEPASHPLNIAKEKLTSSHPNITVNSLNMSVEKFLEDHDFRSKVFRWIIASYVFYHLPADIISKLLVRLELGGVMMLAMGAPHHPLRHHPVLKEMVQHGDSGKVEEYLQTDEIRKKFSYQRFDVPTELNVNGLIDEQGYLTNDGRAFFSFLYNKDIESFSPEELLALGQVFRDILVDNNGICHHHHHLFFVSHKV